MTEHSPQTSNLWDLGQFKYHSKSNHFAGLIVAIGRSIILLLYSISDIKDELTI